MLFNKFSEPNYQLGRVSYSPILDFSGLFDQAFDRLELSYSSRLKLTEDDSNFYLNLELPGYSQKDLEVTVEDYVLTVKAKNEKRGETSRAISLWDGINFDKVSGKLEDGILTVTLPKLEKVKPKRVEIK